ncbi:hypothetical protein, partial [Gardnerella sp. KA00735]|uniref:hypothetical protein n=1 Tax=Gardnerella sp. KA00735 TaxID=1973156 RepID=UPI000CA90793
RDSNPGNTAKAINVIFVPQTNHKTNDLKKSVLEHKTTNIEGKDIPTAYWQVVQKVSNSGEKLGDNLSEAGSYTWDPEAGSVIVAAK